MTFPFSRVSTEHFGIVYSTLAQKYLNPRSVWRFHHFNVGVVVTGW